MEYVIYKDKKYRVDRYKRLILSGLDINDLSRIEGLNKVNGVESLFLYINNISEIKDLENFTDLTALYLFNNCITEIKDLEKLKNLQKLILSKNQIMDIKGLHHLTNLKELNLSGNQIKHIEGLNTLVNLEHLDLRDNQIEEISGLDSLKNLRVLYLDNNQITELKGLDELENLRKLFLDDNNISELKGLASLENLVYLGMQNNPIPKELQMKFSLKEGIYEARSVVKYCRKKEQAELLEEQKAKGEPPLEDETVKMDEFQVKFQALLEEWEHFTELDTYLTYEQKFEFLQKLRTITHFPWYYPLRYLLTYKKVKKQKHHFRKELEQFNDEFVQKRLIEYLEFFDGDEFEIEYPLDPDQREAVIRDGKHNLVVAGAGSGKTSVITSRIAYLVKRHDRIKKDRILALAFTRVAAKEMRDRLARIYNINIGISTFHALGMDIIKKELHFTPNVVPNVREIIKKLFDLLIKNEDFRELFLDYLLYHNEEEVDEKSFEDKQLYYEYMRNLKYSTLNNIQVKSISERNIGNFLFRHNIKFQYEQLVDWVDRDELSPFPKEGDNDEYIGHDDYIEHDEYNDTIEIRRRQYHPDFYLPDYDIYIEHWGLNRAMEVPPWFTITSEAYRQNRSWKLEQYQKHNKLKIETWEYERREGFLLENLKSNLKELAPAIEFIPLNYKDLVNKTSEFDLKAKDIFDLISSFIQIAKSNFLTPEEISERVRAKTHQYSQRQISFAKMVLEVYEEYQTYLRAEDKIDFNDMINLAAELIQRNPEKYLKMYDHILIDEFQDISYQRIQLINCFVNDKSETKLFCVGDDWQSIYQFTGSDVNFFVDFAQYFPYPQITHLSRNYRSAQNIVSMSNQVISRNKNQIKKEIHSYTPIKPKAITYLQFNWQFVRNEKILPPYVYQLVKSLLEQGAEPREIMVISRFNRNLREIKIFCGAHGIQVEEESARGKTNGVRFYSAHKSKGSESKYVIITDLTKGTYGFPCEILDSSVFKVAKHIEEDKYIEEERRLFYVALTRAREYLFLLSIRGIESIFIKEIDQFIQRVSVNSKQVWQKILSEYIPFLKKGLGAKFEIPFFCPKCGNVLVEKLGKHGSFLSCSRYPWCNFLFTFPKNESEKCPNCGSKLIERESKYGKFLGCSRYPDCKYTLDLGNKMNKSKGYILCPWCEKQLRIRRGKYGKFIGCTGYPHCKFTFNLKSSNSSKIKCPQCGKKLTTKVGNRGVFLRCSKYPKCKFTFEIE